MSFPSITIISLLGGLLPALFWLFFWLREDRLHPEPRSRILAAFLAGMVAVVAVLPVERFIYNQMDQTFAFTTLLLWAAAEEVFKFLACYVSSLRKAENDEPIDPIIYLISAALGFSALENAFFLSNFPSFDMLAQGLTSGVMRFVGATVLHTISSATIGIFIALSYYKSRILKKDYLFTGIVLAIILHAVFNSLIITPGGNTFAAFSSVWAGAIVLILIFEKVKTIKKIHLD
jgi:RsiW-degrading membrane proteinase PrsW (M82 family)